MTGLLVLRGQMDGWKTDVTYSPSCPTDLLSLSHSLSPSLSVPLTSVCLSRVSIGSFNSSFHQIIIVHLQFLPFSSLIQVLEQDLTRVDHPSS